MVAWFLPHLTLRPGVSRVGFRCSKRKQILGLRFYLLGKQMLDLKTLWKDGDFGATTWRWDFDVTETGFGQQGMCASWK